MNPPEPRAATLTCITCGLPANNVSHLNRLPNGQVCPACRDRLLETLPPVLPSLARASMAPGIMQVEVDEELHVAEADLPRLRPA
jgi:hypothetical protein